MSFRMYKPKDIRRVKAALLTADNARDLARYLNGRVVIPEGEQNPLGVPTSIQVPTFDGVKSFDVGSWIVVDDDTMKQISNEEFEATYDVAVNRSAG